MLAREFLRLCALEALRPSALLASDAGWPTIAGKYVSDSRIDPIDDVELDERRPLIAVFTEASSLTKIAQAGPLFYKNEVDLVFEISVVGKYPVDGGEPIIDYADTDAAIEVMLGSLEEQIYRCLHDGPTGALFRQMAKLPFDDWISTPHRSGEENIKLARRKVSTKIRVKETCYQAPIGDAPQGFDRLPPALKSIAERLGESTYLADLALGMAKASTVTPALSPFAGLKMTARPQPGVAGTAPIVSNADNLQG